MKEKIKNFLHFLLYLIEELFTVIAIVWYAPIGLIELIWSAIFNRQKFAYNWSLLKDAIRGKRRYE